MLSSAVDTSPAFPVPKARCVCGKAFDYTTSFDSDRPVCAVEVVEDAVGAKRSTDASSSTEKPTGVPDTHTYSDIMLKVQRVATGVCEVNTGIPSILANRHMRDLQVRVLGCG